MDFAVAHEFDATPDAVAGALLDEAFQASLHDVHMLEDRELLSQTTTGTETVRRVRCVLHVELSGTARRFLGDTEPAWIEEATWHPEDMRWDWVIRPEVAKELLDAGGTIHIEPSGEGAVRRVAGRVTVRVPFYGTKVETLIVEGVERAYDEEAERLAAWLEG